MNPFRLDLKQILLLPRWSQCALASAVLLLLSTGEAGAWGRVGHRASGRITLMLLSPRAKSEINKLLEEGDSLVDATTWPDENNRGTSHWHYVNVPLSAPAYDSKYCSGKGCVVSKIHDMRKDLANPKLPVTQRRQALKYLIHFVQDLHQPMHVGDDNNRGGNTLQVDFYGQGTNFHRLWDSELIYRSHRNEVQFANHLKTKLRPEMEKKWSAGTVEDWATESLQAAKKAYINPDTGAKIQAGERLGVRYLEANADRVDECVLKASVRLAYLLNKTLSE
jgi:hypothetical protein